MRLLADLGILMTKFIPPPPKKTIFPCNEMIKKRINKVFSDLQRLNCIIIEINLKFMI